MRESEASRPLCVESSPPPPNRGKVNISCPSLAFDCMTHSPTQAFTHLCPEQRTHVYCVDNAGLCGLGAVRACWACFLVSGSPSSRRAVTQKQARHASVSSHCQCLAYCPLLIQTPHIPSIQTQDGWSTHPPGPCGHPRRGRYVTRPEEEERREGGGATASGGVGGIGLQCVCPVKRSWRAQAAPLFVCVSGSMLVCV